MTEIQPGLAEAIAGHQQQEWKPRVSMQRLPRHLAAQFSEMAPHAVCIVGTDGPVSAVLFDPRGTELRRFGGNRGCWPLRVALSGAWRDTVTPTYNKGPFFFSGVQIRVWLRSDAHARQLGEQVAGLLGIYQEGALGETLEHGWCDVGPDMQLPFLEMEVHALAERLRYNCWDDEGLLMELENRDRKRVQKAVRG